MKAVRRTILLLIPLVFVFGCQHGNYAEQRFNKRTERLGRTAATLARSEARRGPKLQRGFEYMGRELERNSRQLETNTAGAFKLLEKDTERFVERQPDYWDTFLQLIWGKPETIEKTAIDLGY